MSGNISSGASNANGQFHTVNGTIRDPSGNSFTAEGINVYDSQMGAASQILSDFPGINFVRLNVFNYQSPSAYSSFIQTMTSHGVVVELEDHTNSNGSNNGGGAGAAFSGSQLSNELNWYSSVASAYASNPYVWFGTDNEPPSGGLSTWQQETYNAIRNAGNNNPILMEMSGAPKGTISDSGMDPSVYASMSNIIADAHFYGWNSNFSTDQQTVDSSLTNVVHWAQSMQSASGTVPVIIGEYGISTNGSSDDSNSSQVLKAVQQATQSGQTAGAVAWGWDTGVRRRRRPMIRS
ncbi:MAG TPA: cellulase family glycosylhydrolase [Rhodopila sp.]|nr:cellulase family glycosylhydrolase [Rhodopila sp.]